jgi:hypothetical protein
LVNIRSDWPGCRNEFEMSIKNFFEFSEPKTLHFYAIFWDLVVVRSGYLLYKTQRQSELFLLLNSNILGKSSAFELSTDQQRIVNIFKRSLKYADKNLDLNLLCSLNIWANQVFSCTCFQAINTTVISWFRFHNFAKERSGVEHQAMLCNKQL